MSSFWRRFLKSMFYASIIGSVIAVVVVGISMICGDNAWGWMVLLLGAFGVIEAHALIGALIEMMYNIAALKTKLCGAEEEKTKSNNNTVIVEQKKQESDDEEEVSLENVPDKNGFYPWDCPKCGIRNPGKNRFCKNCGYDFDTI